MNKLFDLLKDPNGVQRSAAQVEEVLAYANGSALEDLFPDSNNLPFQICARGYGFGHSHPSFSWSALGDRR
jgi:hypothetical protein